MRIAIAAGLTAFVLGMALVSARDETDSLGAALLGGVVLGVVVGGLVAVWAWALTGA